MDVALTFRYAPPTIGGSVGDAAFYAEIVDPLCSHTKLLLRQLVTKDGFGKGYWVGAHGAATCLSMPRMLRAQPMHVSSSHDPPHVLPACAASHPPSSSLLLLQMAYDPSSQRASSPRRAKANRWLSCAR